MSSDVQFVAPMAGALVAGVLAVAALVAGAAAVTGAAAVAGVRGVVGPAEAAEREVGTEAAVVPVARADAESAVGVWAEAAVRVGASEVLAQDRP
ncbi:MAG: hypothetical protein WBG76_10070 [Ornithinimicrobium sp.]